MHTSFSRAWRVQTLKSSDEAKDFPHELRGAQVPAYAREAYVHRCSVLRSAFCVHGEKNFRKIKHKINAFYGSRKKNQREINISSF